MSDGDVDVLLVGGFGVRRVLRMTPTSLSAHAVTLVSYEFWGNNAHRKSDVQRG